jgi:predicted transcriptional regulator
MESYEYAKSLVSSRLRLDILGSLESPMRLCELRRLVGANAPNTSAKAKDLQRLGLIERDEGDFRMTHAGRLVHNRLSLFFDTMETLLEHREFWMRILDKLPEEMQKSVHIFKGAKLIRDEREHPDKVKTELLKVIRKAKGDLTVVLPAHSKEILDAIQELKTVDTRLKTLSDDPELRYGLISSNSFAILFTELLDMALIAKSALPATDCRTS